MIKSNNHYLSYDNKILSLTSVSFHKKLREMTAKKSQLQALTPQTLGTEPIIRSFYVRK